MTKDLKDKAVNIKGKQYVLVADRINYFNDEYKNGCIHTELISEPESKHVVMKAIVTPDVKVPERKFTGYSQAVVGQGMVNTTSALENAETSAVGRALALMGIGVIESVASVDEIRKATSAPAPASEEPDFINDDKPASHPETMMCEEHGEKMYFKNGKFGPFYSHKNQDGTWHNVKAA